MSMLDPLESDRDQRARIRREQLERARADRARKRAPRRFLVLLALALILTVAVRLLSNLFGWSHSTGTIIVSALVVVLCVVGLPVALAGGASVRSQSRLGAFLGSVREALKHQGHEEQHEWVPTA
jgi:hypothetical protein